MGLCVCTCWQSDDKQVSSTQACNSTISENSSRNKERETRTLWLLAAGIDLLLSVAPLWKTKHTSHNKRTTIWAISRLWYIHASQREMKIGRLLFSRSTMIFWVPRTQGDGQPCMNTVVSHTIDVKTPRSLVLKYKFELTRVGSQEEEQHIINKLLPLLTERIIAPSQPSNPYVVFGRRLARQERAKTRWQGFDVSIREYSRTWIWR
jgi:hypothetical protein